MIYTLGARVHIHIHIYTIHDCDCLKWRPQTLLLPNREIIAVEPRQVKIDQITILGWLEGEFPQIELDIHCGSGTYIRSLARDLGKVLAVGGTLASLTRTESCGFQLADSINLEALMANSEGLISPIVELLS